MKQILSEMEITGYRVKHEIGNSVVYLMHCTELMRQLPDKSVPLACVDPPYGIGQNWSKDRKAKFFKHRNAFNNKIPDEKYFYELFRASENQIIWGANYYWNYLAPSNNIIFWDKGKDAFKQFGSAGEIAWTSITKYPLVKVELNWNGCVVCEPCEKIHPHQKPVALYDWIFKNYAEPGKLILDTHLGSQSSRIAAYKAGLPFIGCELDEDYFREGCQRFEAFVTKDRELKELGFAKTELNKNNPTLFG